MASNEDAHDRLHQHKLLVLHQALLIMYISYKLFYVFVNVFCYIQLNRSLAFPFGHIIAYIVEVLLIQV